MKSITKGGGYMLDITFARVLVVVAMLSACGKKGDDTTVIVPPPAESGQVCVAADSCYDRFATEPEEIPADDAAYFPRCSYQAKNVVAPPGCECPVAEGNTLCGASCVTNDSCPASDDFEVPCANNPELKCQFRAEYRGCKHCPPL